LQSLKRDCFAEPVLSDTRFFAALSPKLRALAQNDKETPFSLHPKSQLLKLIAGFGLPHPLKSLKSKVGSQKVIDSGLQTLGFRLTKEGEDIKKRGRSPS